MLSPAQHAWSLVGGPAEPCLELVFLGEGLACVSHVSPNRDGPQILVAQVLRPSFFSHILLGIK